MSVRRSFLRGLARTRKTLKKTGAGEYAPIFGAERSAAGYKLRGKTLKKVRKERAKIGRKTKRQVRRIWRRLI